MACLKASGVEKLEKEKADLEAWVAKADARILKFKEGLQKFTERAIEKFTQGFFLAQTQNLSSNPDLDLFAMNGFFETQVDSSWCSKEFLRPPLVNS